MSCKDEFAEDETFERSYNNRRRRRRVGCQGLCYDMACRRGFCTNGCALAAGLVLVRFTGASPAPSPVRVDDFGNPVAPAGAPPPLPPAQVAQAPVIPVWYTNPVEVNSYWIYAGAITGAALLAAMLIAIIIKLQQRRREAWLIAQRIDVEDGRRRPPPADPPQGRPPIQRGGSWKTAIPLVVVHPNAEVGVARVDRTPSDLPPGEQAGPIMVPVKRSNDDGVVTALIEANALPSTSEQCNGQPPQRR